MASEFIKSFRTMAAKVETTPGSAETLTTADNSCRVYNLEIGSLDVGMDDGSAKYATGDFGMAEAIPGPTSAQITFSTKGINNTALTEPEWTKFVKGCGCTVTTFSGLAWGDGTTVSGTVVYPDELKAEQSLTVGVYDLERGATPSGLHFQFVGAMGNATISAEGVGKPYMFNYTYTGALNDIVDVTAANIPALSGNQTGVPDRFLAGSGDINGTAVCISAFTFDMGNKISPVSCVGATSGYEKYAITASEPTIELNPRLARTTSLDFWGLHTAGTVVTITIRTSQFMLSIPRAQISTSSVADDDGVLRTPLTFRILRPSVTGSYTYAPWVLYVKAA